MALAVPIALGAAVAAQDTAGVAYFVRDLQNPRLRSEARPEVLDTPVNPGSIAKTIALVAAMESGAIDARTTRVCRRTVTVDGVKFVCSHPDLKRPLNAAEALAHSCNDFFVSLAPRLSRDVLNKTRIAAGLPPVPSSTRLAPAIVGLDGPRTTPRALIDVLARLAGVGPDKPVPMKAATRLTLLEGLRGAAAYGTASSFKAKGLSAMAKTGTIVMPSGAALGLVVALTPDDKPTRAIVVAAPGGAGVDAAAIAADLLAGVSEANAVAPKPRSGEGGQTSALPSTIRLGRTLADGRTRVETIALDDYIAQVLAGEGQPRAADAAQQALAITARTFALANRNRHRGEGFDLCDTTHCQVLRPATETTRRAAVSTSGRVLLDQGQPATVFYSAWCGGRSELASRVWPGAVDYDYEPSVKDEACEDEPAWESEVRAGEIERALKLAGVKGSRLRDLKVLSRNPSDRVARIRVEGFTPSEMSGHEFRMAVGRVAGWQSIKSTAFEIARTSSGYRFRGRGYGHGVGLCVVGAGNRAAKGATADEILRVYFPGLAIGSTSGTRLALGTPGARGTLGTLGTLDVGAALPAGEESERAWLLEVVRTARDRVVKATGAAAPAQLKVTVHPTVDSFNRATGQSWWVSGATNGAEIDLLPIGVLRQQGAPERVIAHEVTHAVLDGALANRPMWVREGAAAYFSSAAPPETRPTRVDCPTDIELLRTVSAGAFRDAYARSYACFARAMAEGKKWNEIK